MSIINLDEFLHDFRQEVLADAVANQDFLEAEFTQRVADELVDAGVVDGFEPCHYRPATGGMRVDGYWFGDNSLALFITDFSNLETIESLTQTEVGRIFKRLENFFTASIAKLLYANLEETSQGYGLSRDIADMQDTFTQVDFFLLSERSLSARLQTIDDKQYQDWSFSYHIWDISRLHRLRTSRGAREELEIDFVETFGDGLPCLPAHLSTATYQSFLVVMPASILADLYGKYGSRLLEQNVRSFLQVRGKVNKGIRATILTDPEMFFAYNNGITATARDVETEESEFGLYITKLKDLQIVNGGQTTASLFHTNRKDKASLDNIFVQMKLSVVDEDKIEEVVPKISEYANTQNRVNAADFFSNHPYHIRMEEFSRRIWAPAQQGAQRETKWFYERARGQFADAQSKLTMSEKKRFLTEYPKSQKFTKTDMAKFELVWSDPVSVNLGAQKNFAKYAQQIGKEWDKSPDRFNEYHYKRLIARAIVFKSTEKIISGQPWYEGGYRANTVAYTIGILSEVCKRVSKNFDYTTVWETQSLSPASVNAIEVIAKIVREDLMNPPGTITNVSEWAKKQAAWTRIQAQTDEILSLLPHAFFKELVDEEDVQEEIKSAIKTQKLTNGIEAQTAVLKIPAEKWAEILSLGLEQQIFSPKEIGILQVATQIPAKLPTEKQSFVLLDILEKARLEAIYVD